VTRYRTTVSISIDGKPFKAGQEITPPIVPRGSLESMLRLKQAEEIPAGEAVGPAPVKVSVDQLQAAPVEGLVPPPVKPAEKPAKAPKPKD
jgi:hypothetical protein